MSKRIEMAGQRFGRLVVIEYAGSKKGKSLYKCKCDCGNEAVKHRQSLIKGLVRSCGCLNQEVIDARKHKHVVINETDFKECYKCKRLLPSTDYYFKKKTNSSDGFDYCCKECTSKRNLTFEELNQIYEYKKEGLKRCSKCGLELPATNEFFFAHKKGKYGLRQECKQCMKKYISSNKERISLKNKEYKEKTKEHAVKIRRIYYKNNAEKVKKYKRENPQIYKFSKLKREAKKLNLPNNFSLNQWEECRIHFNNTCAYCGKESKLTQDHFVPLSKGGEYTINNIMPACLSCNSSKWANDFFEWYPKQLFYSKKREQKILKYLNYDPKTKYQQIAL